LENYIDALSNHILEIQERELAITKNFSEALRKANAEAPKKGKKDDFLVGTESARNLYLKEITDIREKRKQYREMLYDALQERKKLWDSMQIQRDEEEILRRKVPIFLFFSNARQICTIRLRDLNIFGFHKLSKNLLLVDEQVTRSSRR
jgi:hypothetical protein